MKIFKAGGAALALGLAACSGNNANNNMQSETTADTSANATADNVPTDNLTGDSGVSNGTQSLNEANQQTSDTEAAKSAADDVLNQS